MIELSPERPADSAAIEALLDAAFGPDRLKKISYSFRHGVEPLHDLSLVARAGDTVIGTIRAWPIAVESSPVPAILVGPVAVDRAWQGGGTGRRLIEAALAGARRQGIALAVLVGDTSYYGRFGFAPAAAWGLVMPRENPDRVLALVLDPGVAIPSGRLMPQRGCPAAARSHLRPEASPLARIVSACAAGTGREKK